MEFGIGYSLTIKDVNLRNCYPNLIIASPINITMIPNKLTVLILSLNNITPSRKDAKPVNTAVGNHCSIKFIAHNWINHQAMHNQNIKVISYLLN